MSAYARPSDAARSPPRTARRSVRRTPARRHGTNRPSRPASGKRLLEISDSDAAKLLAVLKLLG